MRKVVITHTCFLSPDRRRGGLGTHLASWYVHAGTGGCLGESRARLDGEQKAGTARCGEGPTATGGRRWAGATSGRASAQACRRSGCPAERCRGAAGGSGRGGWCELCVVERRELLTLLGWGLRPRSRLLGPAARRDEAPSAGAGCSAEGATFKRVGGRHVMRRGRGGQARVYVGGEVPQGEVWLTAQECDGEAAGARWLWQRRGGERRDLDVGGGGDGTGNGAARRAASERGRVSGSTSGSPRARRQGTQQDGRSGQHPAPSTQHPPQAGNTSSKSPACAGRGRGGQGAKMRWLRPSLPAQSPTLSPQPAACHLDPARLALAQGSRLAGGSPQVSANLPAPPEPQPASWLCPRTIPFITPTDWILDTAIGTLPQVPSTQLPRTRASRTPRAAARAGGRVCAGTAAWLVSSRPAALPVCFYPAACLSGSSSSSRHMPPCVHLGDSMLLQKAASHDSASQHLLHPLSSTFYLHRDMRLCSAPHQLPSITSPTSPSQSKHDPSRPSNGPLYPPGPPGPARAAKVDTRALIGISAEGSRPSPALELAVPAPALGRGVQVHQSSRWQHGSRAEQSRAEQSRAEQGRAERASPR